MDHMVKIWDTKTWQEVRMLRDPTGGVLSLAFSPDGRRLATGGSDATVKVWDAASGELVRTFHGHSNWVTAVAYSSDGKRIASSSFDGTVKIWHTPSTSEAGAPAAGLLERVLEGEK
jgi:WD40 repeat protein